MTIHTTTQTIPMKNQDDTLKNGTHRRCTSHGGLELLTVSNDQTFSLNKLVRVASCNNLPTPTTTLHLEKLHRLWSCPVPLGCHSTKHCNDSIVTSNSTEPSTMTEVGECELTGRQEQAHSDVQDMYDEREDHIMELFEDSWMISVDIEDDNATEYADVAVLIENSPAA